MRHLPLPTDENGQPLAAEEVYETCVSMVRNPTLRAQLLAILQDVQTEATDYDAKATVMQLYRKQPHNQVGAVSGEELVKVYTHRMVPKTAKGRPTYDRIMSAPVHRRCPLCGIGVVNTLDHYLPKTHFPILSVTPNNLIPACEWCQGEKMEYFPTTEGGQLLHPYFDDLDNDVWLAAEVVADTPAGFRFYTSPPGQWTQAAKERVSAHLKELNLYELFSSNAGSRLSEIRARLSDLHNKGGTDAVREYLREELQSFEAVHNNTWLTAMYRAAVDSEWFCNGGFLVT